MTFSFGGRLRIAGRGGLGLLWFDGLLLAFVRLCEQGVGEVHQIVGQRAP